MKEVMKKRTFFANVRGRWLTIHMRNGVSPRCIGKTQVPAEEDDMSRDGQVEILMDRPYRIMVCRLCYRRWREMLRG